MAAFALTDASAYVHGYDFTVDTNNMMLTHDAAVLDTTTFGSGGWTSCIGGLKTVSFNMTGFWQSATTQAVDVESFPDLGVSDRVYTVAPVETEPASPASFLAAERCFLFKAGKFNYSPFAGQVGDVAGFTLNSMGTNGVGVVQGLLLKTKAVVSATGQMGSTFDTVFGVGAAQSLYATFHEFVAGTTITIQVQSDDNSGFSSATTIGTIGPITTSGGTWMTPIPGPLTDRYYRFNVSAVTGSHTVAAAMGLR